MGLFSLGEKVAEQGGLVDDRTEEEALYSLLQMPKTAVQQEIEKDGKAKFAGKAVLNALTGGLFTPILHPDLMDNRAKYASDLELYQEQQKKGVVDPQVGRLAQYYADQGREELALKLLAADGIEDMDLNSRVVGQGQHLVDGVTHESLFNVDPADRRTAAQRHADDTIAGMNITPDDPRYKSVYSSLVTAYAEPSGVHTLADGSQVPYNTVDSVVSYWNSVLGQPQQNAQSGSPDAVAGTTAAGTASAGTANGGVVTPGMARDATARTALNERDATDIAGADKQVATFDKMLGTLDRIGTRNVGEDGARSFTPHGAVNEVYGSVNALYPDALRGEAESDVIAEIELLTGMLTVEERQKLVGQGQITEGEQEMLARSITALNRSGWGNGKISDAKVAEHMNIIYNVLEDARERARDNQRIGNELTGEGVRPGEQTRRTNFKGVSDEVFEAEIPYLRANQVYTLPDGTEMKWDGEGFIKP